MLIRDVILVEATLYRGDSSKIDTFDTGKSAEYFLLYTHGIYLTDSAEVAGDYTLKDRSEHILYRDEESKTVKDLLSGYLRQIMQTQLDSVAVTKAIRDKWQAKYYDNPTDFNARRQEMEEGLRLEVLESNRKLFKKAKAIAASHHDNMRVMKLTTGFYALVAADREGYVTRFEVPEAYLAKTLNVDQPAPPNVVALMRDLFTEGGDPNRMLDMRDIDGEMLNFDDWVQAYRTRGIDFAWAEDDARVRGGKGELPDLETMWHGTHYGGSWFLKRDNVNKFVAGAQALGYVGLEYQGGKRVGAHTRGGGGHLHRAFVIWNDADVNRFRLGADRVTDPTFDASAYRNQRYMPKR